MYVQGKELLRKKESEGIRIARDRNCSMETLPVYVEAELNVTKSS